MNMEIEELDGACRIVLEGKLDAKGAEALDIRFTAATAARTRVAVDLAGVDYIASIGIRMLVMAGKTMARRSGKLVLYGASSQVAKVLDAAGLTEIVPLLGDRDAALAALA